MTQHDCTTAAVTELVSCCRNMTTIVYAFIGKGKLILAEDGTKPAAVDSKKIQKILSDAQDTLLGTSDRVKTSSGHEIHYTVGPDALVFFVVSTSASSGPTHGEKESIFLTRAINAYSTANENVDLKKILESAMKKEDIEKIKAKYSIKPTSTTVEMDAKANNENPSAHKRSNDIVVSYNAKTEDTKIVELRSQVDKVEDAARNATVKLLNREGKLGSLEVQADRLQKISKQFAFGGSKLQRNMLLKNYKWRFIIAIIAVVIFLILLLMILSSTGALD